MYAHTALLDLHLKHRQEDLEREIARARLVTEATRHQRSLRARVADALYALAELVDGKPTAIARDELTAAA
jgi:hypothetical protein